MLFENLLIENLQRSQAAPCWQPRADVYQVHNGWLLKMELAGVRPEEVQVLAGGNSLTVSGHRRDWLLEQGRQCYSLEITYSRFERTFELPCRLEQRQIATEFRDGMLLIRVVASAAHQ